MRMSSMRRGMAWACGITLAVTLVALEAGAQKKKKMNEKDEAKATAEVMQSLTRPDADTIEQGLVELLAGWQIGDVEMMHKYHADDVVFVSGGYEPPLQGWTNYVTAYQQQRQRMHSIRLDRFNTLIRPKGPNAVVNYQWTFIATVDGRPTGARGHTTLVLEKRADRWLVVHNHTSVVDQPVVQAAGPAQAPPKQ